MANRVSSPRLVGRARELALGVSALSEMGGGATSGLVIGGEAGVGKTRLLAEVLDDARRRNVLTLTGGCIDLGEARLPFGPIVEALRPLPDLLDPAALDDVVGPAAASLGRFIPALGAGYDDALTPHRLFELLFGVLQRLSRRRPVVLAVEDLHWSDQSTRDLLAFLVRNLAHERVLIAITYRSDELHRRHPLRPFLAELGRGGRTVRVDLAPLDRAELGELATDILGNRPSRALLDELLRRSGGNPFLAEELLAASDGSMVRLPPSLRDVLLARVERVPDRAQPVLDAAAVVGHRVDERLLSVLTALSDDDLLDALRTLVSQHVLVPTDTGYRFRHALLQEAVYDELLPGERTRLHTRIAEALDLEAACRPDAAVLAALTHHWSAAHRPERALEAAVRAGLAADQLPAPAEAFVRYEQALELWRSVPDAESRSPVSHLELLRLAAASANLSDNSDRAIALAREALAAIDPTTDPALAGELQERIGRYQWVRGDHEYLDAYEEAVRLVPAEPPTAARARVLAALGQGYMLVGRYAEASQTCRDAIAVARAVGARQPEGHARNTLGVCQVTGGDVLAGEAELRESLRIALEVRDFDDQLRSYNNLCDALARLGRFDDAARVAHDGYALATTAGLRGACGLNIGLNLLDAFAESGRWDEMDRQYATLTEVAAGDLAALNVAIVAVERGDLELARPIVEQGRREAASLANVQMATAVAAAETALAAAEGRYEDGRVAVAEATRRTPPEMFRFNAGPMTWLGARAEADRATAARARGNDTEAADAAEQAGAVVSSLRRLLTDGHPPTAQAYLTMAEAEVGRARGRYATGRWQLAVEAVDEVGLGFAGAYARYRLAEAILLGQLDRAAADPLLRHAVAVFTTLRAEPLRLAAVRLAQRARIDVGVTTGATGTGALTPREHDVLTLVAAGCTNRQIADKLYISAKTASVHVSNILAKLQVRSRGEAAARAHRDGLVATEHVTAS